MKFETGMYGYCIVEKKKMMIYVGGRIVGKKFMNVDSYIPTSLSLM